MQPDLTSIEKSLNHLHNDSGMNTIQLYPGIQLSFLHLQTNQIKLQHDALDHVLEVNYCRNGRVGWQLANGNFIYLGPGDFALHTMKTCATSVLTLPNGTYDGLTICIDLRQLTENPPELLADTDITGTFLYQKFCQNDTFSSYSGTTDSASIFRAFYKKPEHLQTAYYKVKTLELLLYLAELNTATKNQLSEYQSEQVELIRTIHEQLTSNLEHRFTIEELSRQYLINSTTLKNMFKSVYGTSLAGHIKMHRLEKAAELLKSTDKSISEIALLVGYDSPSKFSTAFREQYEMLPSEYRKS